MKHCACRSYALGFMELRGFCHKSLNNIDGSNSVRLSIEIQYNSVAEDGAGHLADILDVRGVSSCKKCTGLCPKNQIL